MLQGFAGFDPGPGHIQNICGIPGLEPLESLSFVQSYYDCGKGLPTWLPDYSAKNQIRRLWQYGFKASGSSPVVSLSSPVQGVLAMQCFRFDLADMVVNKPIDPPTAKWPAMYLGH